MIEADRPKGGVEKVLHAMGEPVDIASLALFRVGFGLILLWDVWRHLSHGWVRTWYMEPTFHFKYPGFGWVDPLPGEGMLILYALLGVCAGAIALGLFYRACCIAFGLGFGYIFLLEEVRYLNHYYLVILLCFLMAFVPAHRALSIDSLMNPKLRSSTAPAWSLWLIRIQIGIVYFYAGLAKLKWDWLAGRPTVYMWGKAALEREWMRALDPEFMAYFLSYGGLLLDLLVVPLLLWRRTRAFVFTAALFFHASNKLLFSIGIFPYMMTLATTLYFEPDWPRRLLARLRPGIRRGGQNAPATAPRRNPPRERVSRAWAGVLVAYLFLQLTIPFRHLAYPGSVIWTEQGQYFAWHMLLRQKSVDALFWVEDREAGKRYKVDPSNFLPDWQARVFAKRPDMVVQFARFLEADVRKRGMRDFGIYADVWVSLNGRKHERLIDPEFDLTKARRTLLHRPYILPQKEPLPPMSQIAANVESKLEELSAE